MFSQVVVYIYVNKTGNGPEVDGAAVAGAEVGSPLGGKSQIEAPALEEPPIPYHTHVKVRG